MDTIEVGLDAIDIVNFINKKGKRYVATTLQDLEEIIPKNSEEYEKVRKLFLNSFNDYKRSVCRAIFGTDLEYTNNDSYRRSDS
jgi:NADPH-dependent 7-cyano-7-deazaguanine reductase QueF-like protein